MGRKWVIAALLASTAAIGVSVIAVQAAFAGGFHGRESHRGSGSWFHFGRRTATPIKHVVVIFQENVSFDHYFATYPNAANTDGQPFHGSGRTPEVDGLLPATEATLPPNLQHGNDLLASNPNESLPQRLDSSPTGTPGMPAAS